MKNFYNYRIADSKVIFITKDQDEQAAKGLKVVFSALLLIIMTLFFGHKANAQVNFYSFVNSASGNALETITSPTVVTTTVGGTFDNDYNLISPAGFTFKFNTTDYTQFAVSTNGWIRLGNGVPPIFSGSIAQTGIDGIYPFTRDANMNIANGGNLTHGPAAGGKYVFQFVKISGQNIPNATSYADAQVVLWGSASSSPGRIEIIYGASSTAPTSQFRAGIGDTGGRTFDGIGGIANGGTLSTPWLAEGRKFTFTPPPVCITPVVQPTSLVFSGTTFSATNLNFTAAAGVSGYLTVRYLSGATPTPPVDGVAYNGNTILGNGVVVNSTTSTAITVSNLSGGTTYDFYVYTYNTSCLGGPVYNTTAPLTGSRTTNTGTLSGIKTVGTGGDYTSLTAAFNAIVASGLGNNMELQLIAGYPASAESYPIANNMTSGVLNGHSLVIYPTVSGLSITGSNSNYLLAFNAARNITLDGRVNRTGAADFTISNTFVGSAPTINFSNDALNNTIMYCHIKGANNSGNSGVIVFGSGQVTGNDFNTIDHCNISDSTGGQPANGIYSLGSGNTDNSGNSVTNNNIFNYFSTSANNAGIFLASGQNNWTISNNRFFQQAPRTSSAVLYGININGGSGYTISNNIIGFANDTGTGITDFSGNNSRFVGMNIALNGNVTSPNAITGNIISGISHSSTTGGISTSIASPTFGGIVLGGSSAATATSISGNTIGAASGNGALTLSYGNTVTNFITGICYGAPTSNHQTDVSNNVVSSITGTSTVANTGFNFTAVYVSNGTGNTVTASGNTVGGETANAISFGTNAQTTGTCSFAGVDVQGALLPNTVVENSNIIKNNTVYSSNTTFIGVRHALTSSSTNNGNIISKNSIISSIGPAFNNSMFFYGVTSSGGTAIPNEVYTNNIVEQTTININNAVTTNMYGIFSDPFADGTKIISGNDIHQLSYTNAGTGLAIIQGILTRRSANIFNNKIYDLTASNSINSQVMGLYIDNAATVNVSNNLIGNLVSAQGNGALASPAVAGIFLNGGNLNANLYYNTISLSGSGGASYYTEGVYSGVTNSLDLRNNIIVNNAVTGGAGKAIAFARTTNVLTAYNNLSNNNLFYAGTPSVSRLLYFDNTNSDQTLSSIKNRLSPRESYSRSKNPVFLSQNGSSPNFLHIDPSDYSGIENGGTPVSGITTDYDGVTRNATTPDIGADEGNFAPYAVDNPHVTVTSTTGTGAPSTQYETLADALFAINTGIHTGTIVCAVNAGYTETAPAGGFVITTTGTAANPISFVKGGAGVSPILYASATNNINANNDAIIKIIGGDYITLDGLNLQENPANVATNAMTEFGVALFYATATDGAQHCTISNCTIDLTATYPNTIGIYSSSCHTQSVTTTLASATTAAGTNSFLSLTGNTITDVNQGIVVSGPLAAADRNDGLIITGNNILAFGSTSPATGANLGYSTICGILVKNTKNFSISNNTITSNGGTSVMTTRAVYIATPNNSAIDVSTNEINSNIISLKTGQNVTFDIIVVDPGYAFGTATLNINGNDFNNTAFTVAANSALNFIRNAGSWSAISMSNNTFSNLSLNSSGSVTLITNAVTTTGIVTINNNSIIGTFTRLAGTGVFTGVNSNCGGSISNNNFSGIANTGNFQGLAINPFTAQTISVNNNTFSNITGLSGVLSGITVTNAGAGSSVNGNTISGSTATSSVVGITLGLSYPGSCSSNNLNGLSSSTQSVTGISTSSMTGDIAANKIYNLETNATGGSVTGIVLSGNINAYNNLVGDLRGPVVNAGNNIIGIYANNGTTLNLYHNTVYLNASSSGAVFGSSALYSNVSHNLLLRNNIFVNNSTVNGGGLAAAYRRISSTVATYLPTSNNNLFRGSTLYADGSSTYTSLDIYKSKLYPHDINSISANPVFLSTSGASPDFLHISPSDNSGIESGGDAVGITTDFDGNTRNANTPDIGADEGSFIALPVQPAVVHVTSTGGTFLTKDYTSFGAALAAINNGVYHTGTIVCAVDAGYTETAPAGGYQITATGTLANPISFVKSGVGSNPVFTASPYHTIGETWNAVFKIIGGDYITIDGFTMVENAANTVTNAATNTMTEFGVRVSLNTITDGAQNCTIKNCTIDLDKNYSYSTGIYSNSNSNSVNSGVTVTAISGSNSNLTIKGNTITDVNTGIFVFGAVTDAGANNGLVIGGSLADANTITDFGTTNMPWLGVGGVNGIIILNTKNFTVSYNNIISNGNSLSTLCRGIYVGISSVPLTGAITDHIDHNNLSIRLGSAASITNEGIIFDNLAANATATVTIDNNNFDNYGSTVAGAVAVTCIKNSGQASNFSISGNTFSNFSMNTSATTLFINNTVATYDVCTVSNNSITGTFANAGTGGLTGFVSSPSVTPVTVGNLKVSNNNFSNVTLTALGSFIGINLASQLLQLYEVENNNISNIITSNGTFAGISINNPITGSHVNGNTVSNISSSNVINGINLGGSSSSNASCYNNVVNGLTSAVNGTINGIVTNSGESFSIYNNKLYNILNTNATGLVNGINISNTLTANIYNNRISDLRVPTGTSIISINGINISSIGVSNIYHNTIYLNATSSGTNFGSSAIYVSTTNTVNLRNNILVNSSQNTGTGLAAAYRRNGSNLATYGAASDNNLLYGTVIYVDGNIDILFNNYKSRVSPRDAHSITENPAFLSTVGSSPDYLRINPATPTGIESGGVFIAGYTTDFDGDFRNTSYPDIGADEGTFTGLDSVGPTITYTPLQNISTLTAPALTGVMATDISGVNVTAGTRPRLYFKKSTDANALSAWKFVETTDTAAPYSFQFNYALLNSGSASFNDIIQYFVVAQDTAAPNVSINSGNFPVAPPSVALTSAQFPIAGTINSFQLLQNLSGTKTVCPSGCDYSSLTLTNGAFDMINKSLVNGDIKLEIAGDLGSETGLIRLNEFASPYKLTIKPTGSPRLIAGSNTLALIVLNAADNVIIDGSLGNTTNSICPPATASRDLTILNNSATANSAVVWLQNNSATTNGATGNTIKNCNIIGNANTTTLFGIGSGGFNAITSTSLGYGNNNNTFQNNDVKKVQIGIFTLGASYGNKNTGTTISQNLINGSDLNGDNVRLIGIYAGFETNIAITGNTIANVQGVANALGISCGGLNPGSNFFIGNDVVNATITNNFIDRIRTSATANFTAGIFVCASGNSLGTNLIANNSISNTFSKGTESGFGICVGGGIVNTNVYHNTVNLSGTATGGTFPNFAFGATGNTLSTMNIRNNIFMNSAVNGTGTGNGTGSYAMGFIQNININSNNNLFYTSGTEAKFIKSGALSNQVSTDYATLAAWRSGSGKDLQSLNTAVAFTSGTDLRPLNTDVANTAIANGGTDLSAVVPKDIDCTTRSATPSIGFKEFYVCGPLAAGTAVATTPTAAVPQSVVSVTGYTAGATMLYQWESATDISFITPVAIGTLSATYTNLTVTSFPGRMWYRLKSTCTNGGAIVYSNPAEVTVIPPGNCLNFDGVDDYVTAVPSTPVSGTFTVEAWVKPTHPTKNMHIFNTRMNGEQSFDIQLDAGNLIHGDIGTGSTWLTTNANASYNYVPGQWLHIAYAVSPTGYKIYANGEEVGSGTYSGTPLLFDATHYLQLGVNTAYPTNFEGSIDEVKVYTSLRSPAQIKMDMISTTTDDVVNQVLYYNFDSGIAGANNAGITTLMGSNGLSVNGTLSPGFVLNGSTSNWVESYAMTVPVIQPATNIVTATSFTANWTAPVNGLVEGYFLDVATSKTFTTLSLVYGYDGLPVSGTSQVVNVGPGIYYYRVRANKSSVYNQGANSGFAEADVPMVAPGNALQFDGTDTVDFVGADLGRFGTGEFTVEFNLRTTQTFSTILSKRDLCNHQSFWDIGVFEGKFQIEIDQDAAATNYLGIHGNILVNDNYWHHVAITRNAAGLLSLYVDGVLDVTGAAAGLTDITNPTLMRLGSNICGSFFQGSIDELRIWSVARTQAEIQSARLNVLTLPQTGLSAYYKFDTGVAGNQNFTVMDLKDYSGNNHFATLYGFNLYGDTSNWVESYAMVMATIAPPSNIIPNGFTAKWTAPTLGTVDDYLLDVSTSPTFASFVTGYNALSVTGTSAVVTGLDGGSYYYRVRPNKISVANQGPYTATSSVVQVPLTPPGNALQFDGINDYVNYTAPANIPVGNSPYTLEAWIYPTLMNSGGIIGFGNYGTAKQVNALRLSGNGIVNYWWSTDLTVTTGSLLGAWHHVAATFDGTTRKIYLDGVVVAQDTPTGHNVPNANNLTIGTTNNQSEFFRGKIDEARVWNVALTQAQIQANMTAPVNPASSGLVLYHNFDKGSLVNPNTGITTVPDQSVNGSTGTMQNFNFTATSNWRESYAMVIPVVQPATGLGLTKFVANWSPPVTGVADSYLIDVSTSPTFATYISGFQGSAVSGLLRDVTNLTAGTYYYRVYAKKASLTERGAASAVETVTIGGTTTWNGAAWSNGVPTTGMNAIIAGPYSSSGNLDAANLTINNNAVVIINSGNNVTLSGSLTVTSGTITFENNANLVQLFPMANTGNITIKRNTSMRRLDYTYWSSPVSGQNLKLFSPATFDNRFYTINETTNLFAAVDPLNNNFAAAVGYSIRAPNDYPTTPLPFTGIFTGIPNNGPVNIQATHNNQGFNLIGNPYPSTISAQDFLDVNTSVGVLYFWTHTAQEAASGANYATFNATGATAASITTPQSAIPNGMIQVGQGFMVQTNTPATLNFYNYMREGNNENQFFRTATDEKHRIWMNLSKGVNNMNQVLIGYVPDATNDADFRYDGKLLELAGSKLYNVINDQKYVIQGRALPFEDTDVVPLGFITETPGSFTISLDHVDGLFEEGQDIFLKDIITGTTHNIKEGPYTFVSDAGMFNNRFEVVYQSAPLAVGNPVLSPEQIILLKENGMLHINTGEIVMQSVNIFDIRGRLIYEKANMNTSDTILNDFHAEQQVLIVKITTADNRTATKRIVY